MLSDVGRRGGEGDGGSLGIYIRMWQGGTTKERGRREKAEGEGLRCVPIGWGDRGARVGVDDEREGGGKQKRRRYNKTLLPPPHPHPKRPHALLNSSGARLSSNTPPPSYLLHFLLSMLSARFRATCATRLFPLPPDEPVDFLSWWRAAMSFGLRRKDGRGAGAASVSSSEDEEEDWERGWKEGWGCCWWGLGEEEVGGWEKRVEGEEVGAERTRS